MGRPWLRLAAALVVVPLLGPALLLSLADLGQDRYHPGEAVVVFLKLAKLAYLYSIPVMLIAYAALTSGSRHRPHHYLLAGFLGGVPAATFVGIWAIVFTGDADQLFQAAAFCGIGCVSGLAAWLILRPDRRADPTGGRAASDGG